MADSDDIRTVRESSLETVCDIAEGGKLKALVATGRLKDFRCCCASVRKMPKKGVCIDPEAAELLEVGVGDEIVMVAR
jgi:arginine N-succinyltransferase